MTKRIFTVAALMTAAAGCAGKPKLSPVPPPAVEYSHELRPGELALRKIDPADYPDFAPAVAAGNLEAVDRSIDQSLKYFANPGTRSFRYEDIDHDRAVATLVALKKLIAEQARNTDGGRAFDAAVRANFDVYQSCGGYNPAVGRYTGEVLFTAYFTPTYDASLTRQGAFQYPIYKRPADLVTPDADHAFRKLPSGQTVPFPTRREIEQGHVLDGQELFWLNDQFNAYIVTVQGPARLRLTDGTIVEVGYAGNNGYEYTSPGMKMIADGLIRRDQISLQAMRDYFTAHPDAIDKYLSLNDRTVFFTKTSGGPFGCLGVPVTTMATIATDKTVYPAGMPALVVGSIPDSNGAMKPFTGLMMDQDRGNAIRAAGRVDIYMGLGEQAGRELNAGKLYYLALKR